MNLEDLQLPCDEHGRRDDHCPSDMASHFFKCVSSYTFGVSYHSVPRCSGGRVPTQAEINALAEPNYEAAAVLICVGGDDHPEGSYCAAGLSLANDAVDVALGGGT